MPTVVGYHGCEKRFAAGVRSGQIALAQWKPSQNRYDWLGEGVYFWEGSSSRAYDWAVERFGDEADVLEAEIDLGQGFSLLESTFHEPLRATYRNLRTVYRSLGWTMPRNRRGQHDLDCLVINQFVKLMERLGGEQGLVFRTVRGVFEEGRPLFPGSALRSQSHIQIAVRDVRCLRVLKPPGEAP